MSASSNKAITKPPPGLPPLPLSQTENGALATAPLSTVINSATDALYLDLYNLVHGEIKIVSVAANATGGAADGGGGDGGGGAASSGVASGGGGQENAASSVEEKLTAAALGVNNEPTGAPAPSASTNPNDALLETRKAKMANLSFAQRRHELTRRVVQHTKSLAHAYALTVASLPKSHSSILQQKALKSHSISSSGGAKVHDPPPRLGATVQVSSDALQFVKSGWVSQDEAQDALYFHHDGLWKARAHCHDVLGALCVLSTPMSGEMSKKESDSSSNDVKKEEEDVHADAMQVDNETSSSKEVTLNNYIGTGGGRWPDFPTDVALAVDRYETSKEKAYSTSELQARLASAVRRKLVLGEVGAFGTLASRGGSIGETTAPAKTITPNNEKDSLGKRRDDGQPLPWRVVLGKGGGSIRLTYGTPRTVSTAEALRQRTLAEGADDDIDQSNSDLQQYPMEARLSVLSESPSAPWKLLSVHVRCSPKTGESDHQLVLNKKQMFDLHRIGERCMIVEEAICRKANEELKEKQKNKDETIASLSSPIVPRPLHRLFEVTHAFALSMQMEILSSQAEALRRGAWGGSVANTNGRATARRDASVECITVSPAYFFDKKGADSERAGKDAPIAVMAVHFWSCDDRYGSPKVGDLSTTANKNIKNNEKDDESMISSKATSNRTNQQKDDNYLPKLDRRGEKRLSLCIRAVPTVGLVVSLSGGSDMGTADIDNEKDVSTSTQAITHHMQRNVDKLLSSIQDPFQLSMSDALLAATVLCADRRCRAMVGALNRQKTNGLPSWIQLEVECGTISVAAVISYPTTAPATTDPSQQSSTSAEKRSPTVLFRLACDSRTGRFVPVFPRPASLLRLLACNDPSASDIQTLRGAALASAVGARLGANNGGNIAKRTEGASRESTGRIVRDAFEALARSTDTLGRKCGVGGDWNDVHGQQSTSLREKSVDSTCHDVKASLMTCCGMASVFGVAAIALKIAGGVDSVADMAGGPIVDAKSNNTDLLRVPPLSIPLRQRIVEKLVREGDGEIKRLPQLQGELFSVSAKVNNETLELVCFDVLTILESASSVPLRLEYAEVTPPESDKIMWATTESSDNMPRPQKRARIATVGMGSESSSRCHHTLEEVEHATLWLDTLLQQQ